MKNTKNADISNIYRLDGQVPIMKAIPFGLQHILAMFVANLTPITIIAGAGGLKQAELPFFSKMPCLLQELQH